MRLAEYKKDNHKKDNGSIELEERGKIYFKKRLRVRLKKQSKLYSNEELI